MVGITPVNETWLNEAQNNDAVVLPESARWHCLTYLSTNETASRILPLCDPRGAGKQNYFAEAKTLKPKLNNIPDAKASVCKKAKARASKRRSQG